MKIIHGKRETKEELHFYPENSHYNKSFISLPIHSPKKMIQAVELSLAEAKDLHDVLTRRIKQMENWE